MEVGVQPAEETPGEMCNANRLQASGLPKCFGKLLWVKTSDCSPGMMAQTVTWDAQGCHSRKLREEKLTYVQGN